MIGWFHLVLIKETCILMRLFGKYMVFGTQLYKIWKSAFNVKNYIFFIHSEPATYFVSRLPFFFFLPYPPFTSSSLPSETDRHFAVSSLVSPSLPFSSLFLFLSFPFDITQREEGDYNGEEPGPEGIRRGWLPLTATTSNSRDHWQRRWWKHQRRERRRGEAGWYSWLWRIHGGVCCLS